MNKRYLPLVLSLIFFFAQSLNAQTSAKNGKEYPTALNHIAIHVHDLSVSTNFYRDILNLKIIPEPFKDGKHTWFTLGPAGHLHLISGAEKGMSYNKNSHLCFSVKSVEDFITILEKSDIEYTNWPGNAKAPTVRVNGVKQIYFQDPDGYWIEVNDDYK